jgi:cardiolipin synthase
MAPPKRRETWGLRAKWRRNSGLAVVSGRLQRRLYLSYPAAPDTPCLRARCPVQTGRADLENVLPRGPQLLNLPNLITIARILLVPVMVWAIASHAMRVAFVLFVCAGISDAVDGFLAKRFNMASELGAYLDPIADKVLIVSIYIALGITSDIPRWLVILVVSRDLLIIGGITLSWMLGNPMTVKPVMVSKLNTVAQILFAGLVLAALGFDFDPGISQPVLMACVAILTLLSIGFYLRNWVRHMGIVGRDI